MLQTFFLIFALTIEKLQKTLPSITQQFTVQIHLGVLKHFFPVALRIFHFLLHEKLNEHQFTEFLHL